MKQCKGEEGLVLSPAFAIARFTTALAKAIKGDDKTVVCCFVRQTGHIADFLKYMTSIAKLGRNGVESTHMPEISSQECVQLQEAAEHIRKGIKLGEAYVTGEAADIRQMVIEMDKPCDLIKVAEPETEQKKEEVAETEDHDNKEKPKATSLYSR